VVTLSSIKQIARLARIHTGALTAIVPVFGYLLARGGGEGGTISAMPWADVLALFAVGLLVHIFGFVQNEYMDREYDSRSHLHRDKPLVSGMVGLGTARFLVFFSIVSSILLLQFYFGEPAATVILALSILCGALYNILGKRFPGMDIFLAAWAFLYLLAGARVHGPLGWEIFAFAGMAALQIFFNNGIEGGLKDSVTDGKAGARTMAVAAGVEGEREGLNIPLSFKLIAWALKLLFLGVAVSAVLFSRSGGTVFDPWRIAGVGAAGVLACVMLACQLKFLTGRYERKRMLRLFAVHEISSVCMILALGMPLVGIWSTLGLMALPIIWLLSMNRVLYGTILIPKV